jgi:D-3-phosphoglycerate dehydrogenase
MTFVFPALPFTFKVLSSMVQMKIVVADRISQKGIELFKAQDGFEVIEAYGSSKEQLLQIVPDVKAIVVRSETKVDRDILAAAKELIAVGRAGVGVDNIDIDGATKSGVVVMNTPGGNTVATAELTFTHLLCGARPIVQACETMRQGKWDRKKFPGTELRSKTLAVLGMGRIGSEVAKRAKAFEMKVIAYDPYLTESRAEAMGVEIVDIDTAFAKADYITVHMPLTDSTRGMVNANAISRMKTGVHIFNCARGGIIDEAALADGLNSGKIAAAGLDVYSEEPLAGDSPLRNIQNLVLTPHLGASTQEAQESVGLEIAESITQVLQGGPARNAVNMPSVDSATLEALKPYMSLGEKLGSVLQQATTAQVETIRISLWGRVNELDNKPLARAIQLGYLRRISGDNLSDVNAPAKMKDLGVAIEIVNSTAEVDYTDFIELQAVCSDGNMVSVSGTIMGKESLPRLVQFNGRAIEANLDGNLLILYNRDTPGIVGLLGTILGKDSVNIANMSLSRAEGQMNALTIFELDTSPSREATAEILANPDINDLIFIRA